MVTLFKALKKDIQTWEENNVRVIKTPFHEISFILHSVIASD